MPGESAVPSLFICAWKSKSCAEPAIFEVTWWERFVSPTANPPANGQFLEPLPCASLVNSHFHNNN